MAFHEHWHPTDGEVGKSACPLSEAGVEVDFSLIDEEDRKAFLNEELFTYDEEGHNSYKAVTTNTLPFRSAQQQNDTVFVCRLERSGSRHDGRLLRRRVRVLVSRPRRMPGLPLFCLNPTRNISLLSSTLPHQCRAKALEEERRREEDAKRLHDLEAEQRKREEARRRLFEETHCPPLAVRCNPNPTVTPTT